MKTHHLLHYERKAKKQGFSFIVGIDEVGRGPLAGPVVAAAVSLTSTRFTHRIDDSKKLTHSQRLRAFHEIIKKAHIGVGIMNESVIDAENILGATLLAMEQAAINLIASLKRKIKPSKICVFVDGNAKPNLAFHCESIVKGDGKSLSIASASIVAKVIRDRIMEIYDQVYPGYNFHQHKGYGTQKHYEALAVQGVSPLHRRSFTLSHEAVCVV